MSEFDDDGWDDLRPDLGDYRLTFKETFAETGIFVLKVLGLLLSVAFVIALFAYDIWREWSIFQLLSGA